MHSPLYDADAVVLLSCFFLSHWENCSWSCHWVNSSFRSLFPAAFIGLDYSKPILTLSLSPSLFQHGGARFICLYCVFKFVHWWWAMSVWQIGRWGWCLCRNLLGFLKIKFQLRGLEVVCECADWFFLIIRFPSLPEASLWVFILELFISSL
jgi:hypothetical protein